MQNIVLHVVRSNLILFLKHSFDSRVLSPYFVVIRLTHLTFIRFSGDRYGTNDNGY